MATVADGLKRACAMQALQEVFSNQAIEKTIMNLSGTRLGFMMDKQYPYNVVKNVAIEALLRGFRITGNEFNIIMGQFYAAKEGKFRLINEYPGLTDFQFTNTPPQVEGDKAKVQLWASWRLNGKEYKLGYDEDGKIDKFVAVVIVNKAMGNDAIIGKAQSKLFTRVMMRLSSECLPDADIDNIPEAETVTEDSSRNIIEEIDKIPTEIRERVAKEMDCGINGPLVGKEEFLKRCQTMPYKGVNN
jgi:hypothetical protein